MEIKNLMILKVLFLFSAKIMITGIQRVTRTKKLVIIIILSCYYNIKKQINYIYINFVRLSV